MSPDLKEAILQLSQFFSLFTLTDLIGASITDDKEAVRQAIETLRTSNAISDESPIAEMSRLIVDIQTGSLFSKDIIDRFIALAQSDAATDLLTTFIPLALAPGSPLGGSGGHTIKEYVGNPDGLNDNPNDPSKDSPSLAVFSVNTTRITPSTRNGNAVSLFMNAIPSIEFSKAVPFLDIQFQLNRPAFDLSGRPQTLSITRFLEGGTKIEPGTADHAMHGSVPVGRDDVSAQTLDPALQAILGESPNGFGGMELFTSPQTMVNADPDDSDEVRVAPVVDKFRPLMSIVDFTVSVVATTGIMSYKTAKLELVLHDRSRLYEIADFVKPDMAGSHNSELLIEYGWSHPDVKTDINPYGPFINSLRKKEKYHIRNSSFAIKENGEITISLELYMKGALDFYNETVTDGGEIREAQKAVADLQERLSDLRSRVYKQQASHMKEIRGVQILNAAEDQTSQLELSKEMKKELRSVLRQLKNTPGPDATSYAAALEELYGKDGTGENGVARTLLTKLSNELQRRMNLIEKGKFRTYDPFTFNPREALENFPDRNKKDKESNYVSFGKLAMIFIGQPLVGTHKFDEVQLIFYPLNSGAGFARSINVAQFPIEIARFKEKFNKIKTLRRSNNLTLRDFCQFMGSTFFDDPAALGYGMRDLYSYEDEKETGTKVRVKRKDLRNNPSALAHEQDRRMKLAGVPGGVFKMPQLDIYIEAVPAEGTDNVNNSKTINDSRTILRVHFFDRLASSYESIGELLRAVRDSDIASIKAPPPPAQGDEFQNDHDKIAQQMFEAAKSFGLIEDISTQNDKSAIQIVGGPRKLKEFIRNTMPSITYGINNSPVITSGFKTLHDPRLSTVNMLRTGDASPITPTGVGQGGLPLWMHPGQADMQIMGCPIIEFAQGFFIDFQTNTSIDNIYHVTKIDHSIKQGEFKTSLSFVPFDAYGQYRALVDRVSAALSFANKLKAEESQDSTATNNG